MNMRWRSTVRGLFHGQGSVGQVVFLTVSFYRGGVAEAKCCRSIGVY